MKREPFNWEMFDEPAKAKNFAALEEEVVALVERVAELEKAMMRLSQNEAEMITCAQRLRKVADLLEAQVGEIEIRKARLQ